MVHHSITPPGATRNQQLTPSEHAPRANRGWGGEGRGRRRAGPRTGSPMSREWWAEKKSLLQPDTLQLHCSSVGEIRDPDCWRRGVHGPPSDGGGAVRDACTPPAATTQLVYSLTLCVHLCAQQDLLCQTRQVHWPCDQGAHRQARWQVLLSAT